MTYEIFKSEHLELISLEYDVRDLELGKRFVVYGTSLGDVTYYPNADRLQIHKGNIWKSNGFDLLKNSINLKS